MEEFFAALKKAFEDYRQDVENYERKKKPTDGLLGFGKSLQDDPCHERLDERVKNTVEEIRAARPAPEDAKRAVGLLLSPPDGGKPWPLAAEWMLRAIERHALPLIPFLSQADAAVFLKEYAGRYRPWDRLPVQRQVFKALKEKA